MNARVTSNADVVRQWEQPAAAPVWRAGLITTAALLLADLLLPDHPLSAALPVLLALTAIAGSARLSGQMTALATIGSVLVGAADVMRSPDPTGTLTLRLGLSLLILVTGTAVSWWTRRAPPQTPPPVLLPDRLRAAATPAERATQTLAYLTGARAVDTHRVDDVQAWLARLDLIEERPPRRSRLEALRLPARRLPLPEPATPGGVWRTAQGDAVLTLSVPGQGHLLIHLTRPSAPTHFIADAAQILQMQLERATLFEQVQVQRELLRDLVYAFSHDLRTPITANILHAEAALGGVYGPLSDALAQTLRHAQEANRDLLTVSDQLMLLAEYESGDPTGEPSVLVNLESVVRRVVADVQIRAAQRQVSFELNLSACHVLGHAYDLRRATQNLLENAVKFSPEGHFVRVTIHGAGGWAHVEVMDQGPGVPEDRRAQLFQRYRTSTRGSGTGFGLYLTRRIAERYGGTITYGRDATDRPWSTFALHLPLANQH